MKLDEAIKHEEELVNEYEGYAKKIREKMKSEISLSNADDFDKYAKQHRQLAEWLKELKKFREEEPCEDCVSRQAVLEQTYSWCKDEFLRTTNPFDYLRKRINSLPPVTPTSSKMEQVEWIPVSERLPKTFEFVNCTCHSLIDDREDWVVETCYIPQFSDSPYSDWGNIPMLNEGNCEVVAWIHRDIPKPYKAESEE